MTEYEFQAARRVADRTSRPDTAFSIIVALACVSKQLQASKLAELIGVHLSSISMLALKLEKAGVLQREWSMPLTGPHKPGERRRRGKSRFYSLTSSWPDRAPNALRSGTDFGKQA